MFVEFKAYANQERQSIDVERIVRLEAYSSNGYSGSILYLDDGSQVLIGNYPSDARELINKSKIQFPNL